MAKGTKTGGKDFGTDGHKSHRPKHDPDFKALAQWTKTEIEAKMHNMLQQDYQELAKMVSEQNRGDKKTLDLWIATIILKGIAQGDTARLNFMFEQIYGKLPEVKQIDVRQSMHSVIIDAIETLQLTESDS
jgi:hypothetical protein